MQQSFHDSINIHKAGYKTTRLQFDVVGLLKLIALLSQIITAISFQKKDALCSLVLYCPFDTTVKTTYVVRR